MKKRMPWLRLYTEVLDDPKVQRLPPHLFKTWVNLLCLAGEHGGNLPSVDDIAFRLRMSAHDAAAQLDELILAGLIDIASSGERVPHNWSTRQFVSDCSTERVRKYRKQKEKQPRNGDETLRETAPEPEPESETESESTPLPPQPAASSASEVKGNLQTFVGGRGGVVSVEARRRVCADLAIGNADPLVRKYEAWPVSRTANDPDALFISTAPKLYREASPGVVAACQPLIEAPPPIPISTARPSAALVASITKGKRYAGANH